MVKKADIPRHLIDTALALAAERGWRELSLSAIAAAAELPLSKVYPVYRSKRDILDGLARQVDAQVLAGQPAAWAEEDTPRDRLFDVLMRRLDVLDPYKPGIAAILRDLGRDPLAAACGMPPLMRSMAWMLEAAGIASHGVAGCLRTKGLAIVWLATLRVWLGDDSPDKARCMAALDGRLRRAEQCAAAFTDRRRGDTPPAAAAAG
jgi:AcrR family transcriptional regulator